MTGKSGALRTVLQVAATCLALFCVFTANERLDASVGTLPEAVETVAETDGDVRMLPVLMYHAVLRDESRWGDYVISPDLLEKDLDYLVKNGYETVSLAQLIAFVNGQGELPEKPVLITFDDGHFNNYFYAYPLLKDRGMCAVVSVIGRETERFTENGQENPYWSYLSAARLLEMVSEGVFEVQNHSYDLHAISNGRRGCLQKRGEDAGTYRSMLVQDAEKTQHLLTDIGIPEPVCYTYPYGLYDADTEAILKEMGFACTMNCEERQNRITRDPDCLYGLGRYNRPSGESTEQFMKRALGL